MSGLSEQERAQFVAEMRQAGVEVAIAVLICGTCGRHTGSRDGRILRHSDYRLLPMAALPCPTSGTPVREIGGQS